MFEERGQRIAFLVAGGREGLGYGLHGLSVLRAHACAYNLIAARHSSNALPSFFLCHLRWSTDKMRGVPAEAACRFHNYPNPSLVALAAFLSLFLSFSFIFLFLFSLFKLYPCCLMHACSKTSGWAEMCSF